MPPVVVCVGGGGCWFGGSASCLGVGAGHRASEHVDNAAADVDVEGKEGAGGEVAERLEGCVESLSGFGVEREVDLLLLAVVVFGLHGGADEGPAAGGWAGGVNAGVLLGCVR